MITGCVGGVLRDILCTEVPLLFRSELYATVSLVTGAIYLAGIKADLNHVLVVIATFIIGLALPAAGDPLQMGNAEVHL